MEQSSFQDEQTVRHQFDSLCKLALKSEVINYEKHMAYRQKYEVMLSELSEKELSRLFEYSCAMKSHFRKFGNQMSGSGNHLCNYASLLA